MGRGNAPKAPGQRRLRVGEAMRHVLAEMIGRDGVHDPRLDGVSLTVSEVRISPDLRQATVYVAELGRELRPETREALDEAAPSLRGRVARELNLRYAPELRFVADESFAEAGRIGRLIAEARRSGGEG